MIHDRHILSKTLLAAAIVDILSAGMNLYCRMARAKSVPAFLPFMTDDTLWNDQLVVSVIQVTMTSIVFLTAFMRYSGYRRSVTELEQTGFLKEMITEKAGEKEDADDAAGMSVSAQEIKPEGSRQTTLSVRAILQLLQIWACILIGVRVIYDICVSIYRGYVEEMAGLFSAGGNLNVQEGMVALYNGTHGFKYIGMFIAIILGILVTGIFLKDRFLWIFSAALTGIFMIAFVTLQMGTITIAGRDYGIVWTAVIFHLVQTIGILLLSVYLRRRYQGL